MAVCKFKVTVLSISVRILDSRVGTIFLFYPLLSTKDIYLTDTVGEIRRNKTDFLSNLKTLIIGLLPLDQNIFSESGLVRVSTRSKKSVFYGLGYLGRMNTLSITRLNSEKIHYFSFEP